MGISRRYFNNKVEYAVQLHKEGYSLEYIKEDLRMEFSYLTIDGAPLTEAQINRLVVKVIENVVDWLYIME